MREITKPGQRIDRAFLFSALSQPNTILLESSRQDSSNNKNLLFTSPIDVLTTDNPEEIPSIFEKIEKYVIDKKWIAGFVGYECGYHFEEVTPRSTHPIHSPLLWFGVYDSPITIEADLINAITIESSPTIQNAHLSINDAQYVKIIDRLKKFIVDGDTYQVNFTDRFEFDINGDIRDLYFELRKRQHVSFGAFLNIENHHILSFSPELFFRRDDHAILTKPMKGTCKRGRTNEEDDQFSEWLRNDEKNRSENLMIVDLLRNDIGRICNHGSVEVSNMYSIERYETILQMTSTVNGILKPGIGYYDIFQSLFPCGSVTGAPKIRTMQIIQKLEQHPRGVYCGAIGFISPENESVFNVAIRTIDVSDSKGIMGVGSGIVFDSDPEMELEECKLKAAFLLNDTIDFQLLETLLWQNSYTFLEQHLERLKGTAFYHSFHFNRETIIDALNASERSFLHDHRYRVRLLLSQDGKPLIEAVEITHDSYPDVIKIAGERTHSADKFLYHKTTHRKLYDRYSKKANEEHIADFIFLNENNEITEGAITNIFIEMNGILFTPPVSSGLLPGVYRQKILSSNPSAIERIIKIDDLRTADAIYICNSVRGWHKVSLSE